MKKVVKIVVGIFIALLLLIGILPFLFKDKIIQFVKDEANNNLNAVVDFGEFNLDLIHSFPDFSLHIENVSVKNVGDFEGKTLANIPDLRVKLDLMSVISGDEIQIKRIALTNPTFGVYVLEDGRANWDIAKPSTDSTSTEEEESSGSFKLALQEFSLENCDLIYDDKSLAFYMDAVGLDYTLSGDFTADFTALKNTLQIDTMNMVYDNVKYLNQVLIDVKADLDADLKNSRYTFKENEFKLNELLFGLNGWVDMSHESDISMDLAFSAEKSDFKNFLSLVPAIYANDFASVSVKGNFAFNGTASGKYTETAYPAFDLNFLVENGLINYPDLPKSIAKLNIDLNVSNPGGTDDQTIIDLKKMHMEMAGNPFDMKMRLTTPISDPNIDAHFKGIIDLATVKEVVPLEEGEEMNGVINSDITMAGRLSSIEKEEYEKFNCTGKLIITALDYKAKDLPYTVALNKMSLEFSPKFVQMDEFDAKVGKSDFKASGRLENFIAYALKDEETLYGKLDFNSSFMDVNEFMTEEEGEATTTEGVEEEPLTVVEIPKYIDFTMNSKIDRLLYDNMDITNMGGKIIIKNQQMVMENVGMNLLDGKFTMDGYYETTNPAEPTVNFKIGMADFDFQKTAQTFNTMVEAAPMLEYCKGMFSTKLNFSGKLDQNMEIVMNSLTGDGDLKTKDMIVEGFKPMVKVSEVLKNNELSRMIIGNSNMSYEFKDGRFYLDPFDMKLGKGKATMDGSNGFDQTMDYKMKVEIPRSELGALFNDAANNASNALAGATGVKVNLKEVIKFNVGIGGTNTEPKITTDLKEAQKDLTEDIKEQVKEQVKEKVDSVKKEIKEDVNKEIDKIMADARAQADKIRAEGKNAADAIRKEGYANADKLVADAKNPIAKKAAEIAADKLRKETDAKAQKVEDEANKKADQLVADAQTRADALKNK